MKVEQLLCLSTQSLYSFAKIEEEKPGAITHFKVLVFRYTLYSNYPKSITLRAISWDSPFEPT